MLEHVTLNNGFQDLALSPDGRKVVFAARGEIWAASARDGGDAVRVTRTWARESQIDWTADSRRIVYVSEREGVSHLFLYDFTTNSESQLTSGDLGDAAPVVSPDGRAVAFVRDAKELRSLDLTSRQERVLAKGFLSRSNRGVAWSPDSRWVAYVAVSARSFRNLFAVPAAGGDARALTAVPNGNANSLSWSPDGTYIIFNTNQRTEPGETVRVDLVLKTPRFREDRFRDLFKDEPPRPPSGERRAEAGDTQTPPAPTAPVNRVRRYSSSIIQSPGRPGCQCPNDQPRWSHPAADRNGGRSTEPLCVFARRALPRARRCASAHLNSRREGGRAIYVR
jgi:Tol biopolymer transport system component